MLSSCLFDVMKSTFILNHINQLQLIAATYVRECISEYFFSVLFANISTQKKLDHMLIWRFAKDNGQEKSFFGLFVKVSVREMIKLSDFLNLQNFMVAKVSDLKVVLECFNLKFQDYVILLFQVVLFEIQIIFCFFNPELSVLGFQELILQKAFLRNKWNL